MAKQKYHEIVKDLYGVPDMMVKDDQRRMMTGVCRVTAWRMEKQGTFPARRRQNGGVCTWSMAELLEWQELNDRNRSNDRE